MVKGLYIETVQTRLFLKMFFTQCTVVTFTCFMSGKSTTS